MKTEVCKLSKCQIAKDSWPLKFVDRPPKYIVNPAACNSDVGHDFQIVLLFARLELKEPLCFRFVWHLSHVATAQESR